VLAKANTKQPERKWWNKEVREVEEIRKILNQEVVRTISEVKSKSTTYGEARKIIEDLDWGSKDELKTLVARMAHKRLQAEMDELPIQK
jgi:hypothetical protein